jgi:membrane protein DedA with SNARE-associated domain
MIDLTRALPYVGIFVAAVVEGEAVFVAASVAVAMGHLNGWGVLVAGALGGSAGDQAVFYAMRGRLGQWLERSPAFRQKRDRLQPFVHRYAVPLVAASRFLPGLRMAIPAACATASISPWLFSTLSLASAFAWAGAITTTIAWAGPTALARLGLTGGTALLLPAALVIVAFVLLRRITGEAAPG